VSLLTTENLATFNAQNPGVGVSKLSRQNSMSSTDSMKVQPDWKEYVKPSINDIDLKIKTGSGCLDLNKGSAFAKGFLIGILTGS